MTEYLSTTSNATACYASLHGYGARGQFYPIVSPRPVTATPSLFNLIKPAPLAKPTYYQNVTSGNQQTCGNYRRYDQSQM